MNKERQLLDAMKGVLEAVQITYGDGHAEPFVAVHTGSIPDSVGYPVACLVPLGPQFLTEVLGGQGMNRKSRFVAITIEIHYEHHDKEMGVLNMSDILWHTVDALLKETRLGGAEALELGEIDYAYRVEDEESDGIPDWGYKGVALIPVLATYRYS